MFSTAKESLLLSIHHDVDARLFANRVEYSVPVYYYQKSRIVQPLKAYYCPERMKIILEVPLAPEEAEDKPKNWEGADLSQRELK